MQEHGLAAYRNFASRRMPLTHRLCQSHGYTGTPCYTRPMLHGCRDSSTAPFGNSNKPSQTELYVCDFENVRSSLASGDTYAAIGFQQARLHSGRGPRSNAERSETEAQGGSAGQRENLKTAWCHAVGSAPSRALFERCRANGADQYLFALKECLAKRPLHLSAHLELRNANTPAFSYNHEKERASPPEACYGDVVSLSIRTKGANGVLRRGALNAASCGTAG